MRRELARKAIHVSSVVLPLLVWMVPRAAAVAVLAPLACVAVAADVTRLRWRPARYWIFRWFRPMLRAHERRGWTGATWMVLSYAAAVALFPKPVAVAAMLFNGLGDAAAALVGKRWGRRRTRWGKSWEGFAAGLAVNLAVAAAVSGLDARLPLAAALAGAVTAALLEFLDLPVDDNPRITLGSALVMFIAGR